MEKRTKGSGVDVSRSGRRRGPENNGRGSTRLGRLALVLGAALISALPFGSSVLSSGCSSRSESASGPPGANEETETTPVGSLSEELLLSTVTNPIVSGALHTCALLEGGLVKCWGRNASAQLGLGNLVDRGDAAGEMGAALPSVALGTGRTAKALVAGEVHTCALLDNNQVKCWGDNYPGQLGIDTSSKPERFPNPDPGPLIGANPWEMGDNLPQVNLGAGRYATALAAGARHTCALLDNKQIKCWGDNSKGQLGLGDTLSRGRLADQMGDYLPVVNLGTGRIPVAITAGSAHTCALLKDKSVVCWGANADGQLGLGDTNNRGDTAGELGDNLPLVSLGTSLSAKAIAAGPAHTCVILNNNQVKCWGRNDKGQLGLGDTNSRGDQAEEMGAALPTVALGTSRSAQALGMNAFDEASCVVLNTGEVKCWGRSILGLHGQWDYLGDGAGEMGDALPAVSLGTGLKARAVSGGASPCAVLTLNRAKCWGENAYGQLGVGDKLTRGDEPEEMGEALPLVDFGRQAVRAVATGGNHACAITDTNQVKCWGANSHGQLGTSPGAPRGDQPEELGHFDAVPLGALAKALALGNLHSCALLVTGEVKCWGRNDLSQLGQGSTTIINTPVAIDFGAGRTVKSVAAGQDFTCAILDNDRVKCWGYNASGQLGLGDVNMHGDGPGEMGDALPFVDLGTGRTAKAIALGASHACVFLDNSQIKCWGANLDGQLGLGDLNSRGDAPNEMGDKLPAVDLGSGRTAKDLGLGRFHSCAILDKDQLKCWGWNPQGALGIESNLNRGAAANEMGDNLPIVNLGTGRTAKAVVGGDGHTCAILDTNQLKCWGTNSAGQSGRGDTLIYGDQPGEMGDYLPLVPLGADRSVASVASSNDFTCARLNTNEIKCWGANHSGKLGLGNTAARGDNPGEMGSALPAVNVGDEAAGGAGAGI